MQDKETYHRLLVPRSFPNACRRCNEFIFENKSINFNKILLIVENDLVVEMNRLQPVEHLGDNFAELGRTTPPLGTLKLNIDAAWRNGDITLATLVKDDRTEPRSLWFTRTTCLNAKWARAKVFLRMCMPN